MNRKLLAILVAGALCLGAIGPAAAAKKKKKKSKNPGPVVVFEDAAGDAGINAAGAIPGVEQGGFDLTKGIIEAKGKDLVFTVEHSAMPSGGTLPEGFRLLWHFTVDGEQWRFTVKSGDIGKPDLLAGSGDDRVGQVDTEGHFRLEQCIDEALPAVLTLINCNAVEDGYLEGAFDPSTASVSWTVPLGLMQAKRGSEIAGSSAGAAASGCMICWVPHYAERSLTPHTIIDAAAMATSYKVP